METKQTVLVAPEQLANAVYSRDLQELERICIMLGKYSRVTALAEQAGLDLGELEDALQEI